jgi:hypothetical protein
MPTQEQVNDLEKTLAMIERADREPVVIDDRKVSWGQDEWIIVLAPGDERLALEENSCGTAACLCGTRALMDGAKVLGTNAVRLNGVTLTSADQWQAWGANRFGISAHDARILFDYENTMLMMRHYVDAIKAGDLPLLKKYSWDFEDDHGPVR